MKRQNSGIEKLKKNLSQHLPDLKRRYNVETLELFGSRIHDGKWSVDSDLDILVTFSSTPSLLEFVNLKNHLTDLLGVQVDLVMPETLKPGIKDAILEERVAI